MKINIPSPLAFIEVRMNGISKPQMTLSNLIKIKYRMFGTLKYKRLLK